MSDENKTTPEPLLPYPLLGCSPHELECWAMSNILHYHFENKPTRDDALVHNL
jgi:hypothetical protein